MCDIHMCISRYDHADSEVGLGLFRSISSEMPLNRKIRTARKKGSATEVVDRDHAAAAAQQLISTIAAPV
jgi:hypothetical protein